MRPVHMAYASHVEQPASEVTHMRDRGWTNAWLAARTGVVVRGICKRRHVAFKKRYDGVSCKTCAAVNSTTELASAPGYVPQDR